MPCGRHADRPVSSSGRWVTGRRAGADAVRGGQAGEAVVGTWVRRTPGPRDLFGAIREAGTAVLAVARSTLDGIALDHHVVAARVLAPRELTEGELAEHRFAPEAVVVVLDGITDPHNLGAAARTAEAAGA